MPEDPRYAKFAHEERTISKAEAGDPDLGPLKDLPGVWNTQGRGWNMIALPFEGGTKFRLLLNQYKETLRFSLVDKAVPNRGLDAGGAQLDQRIVTLDYEQVIAQVAVEDRPQSTVAGAVGAGIHHEPGLFLNMLNATDDGPNIARLASIPHGDSALALGTFGEVDGAPEIPAVNGLPTGVTHDLVGNPYLEPYAHYDTAPFLGNLQPPFPGFNPVHPHLLIASPTAGVRRTTVLDLSTETPTGGITNIPFIVRQANAASMNSTFWIQELESGGFELKYLQVVMLDFFPRRDGLPGLVGWPHVSINALEKVSDDPDFVVPDGP